MTKTSPIPNVSTENRSSINSKVSERVITTYQYRQTCFEWLYIQFTYRLGVKIRNVLVQLPFEKEPMNNDIECLVQDS